LIDIEGENFFVTSSK